MEQKIAVALSGGVDSLVSAWLLKQQNYRLFGIHFITGFEDPATETNIASISDQLSLPVTTVDIRDEFKQHVVDYFISAYQTGRTPNPCIVCNSRIKFGVLLEIAIKMGAARLATGHYAGIGRDDQGGMHLYRGTDPIKDQSYFLAFLTSAQLARACFPLSDLAKTDVIRLAKSHGLKPADRNESQDICFIRGCSYAEFLSRMPGFAAGQGPILDMNGKEIGRHPGLHHFTVGQRRGINVPFSEPYYVIRMDVGKNQLVVGVKDDLLSSGCRVSGINWIAESPESPMDVWTQVRYRNKPVPSTLVPTGEKSATVHFKHPQAAITPGQGAVFYRKNEVLGGGWIENGQ